MSITSNARASPTGTDWHDSLSIERGDLLAVVASGPRGVEKLRLVLQTNRLQLSIGPYLILGRIHTKPGLDPVASIIKREAMIPLTQATIAYEVAGAMVVRDIATIIVNRTKIDWVSPSTDAETIFPDVPVRSPFAARLAKDFTDTSTI